MKILFVAFEFPPLKRGGVYRSLAFVKYLPVFGIEPVVITLDSSSFQNVYGKQAQDDQLGKDIIEQTIILPVKSGHVKKKSGIGNFLSIYFSIHGNETSQWKLDFKATVESAIKQYNPDLLFATVPPFSVLPLVFNVSKKFKIPMILDFRDAWSQWRSLPYGSFFHYKRTKYFERKYLEAADAVITTTDQTREDFLKLYPALKHQKLYTINNGFDGVKDTWHSIDLSKELFVIGYVGSFYYDTLAREQMFKPWWKKRWHRIFQYIRHKQDWRYRSPFYFFSAMQEVNKKMPQLRKRVKIRFAGNSPDWMEGMIKEFGLESQVECVGELSHNDSLKFQQSCDALLITSAKQHSGLDYSIAGKTYEYIQMQKPVLAFVCDGAQKDLLIKTGIAIICDPDAIHDSAQNIVKLFTEQLKFNPNQEFISTLTRENLTAKLALIIKKYAIRH